MCFNERVYLLDEFRRETFSGWQASIKPGRIWITAASRLVCCASFRRGRKYLISTPRRGETGLLSSQKDRPAPVMNVL